MTRLGGNSNPTLRKRVKHESCKEQPHHYYSYERETREKRILKSGFHPWLQKEDAGSTFTFPISPHCINLCKEQSTRLIKIS